MGFLAFDLHDALRSFRRDRAYVATTLLTLALTIGATTTIFSIVNGVLLEPLAYPEPQRLVALREVWHQYANRAPSLEINERHFEYWREHAQSFESLAQYKALPTNLTGAGDAAQVTVVHSSGSLFDVLRVTASEGRTLTPADEPEGAPDVAVVSDGLWRQRLGGDSNVIGRPLVLDGRPYTIVGVLPAAFRLPGRDASNVRADAFIPLRVTVGWAGEHNNQAFGRLRAGVSPDAARAELDVLQAQVSDIATKAAGETVTLSSVVTPLGEYIVGRARQGLLLLLAGIAGVLLIACANLANLSLTRTLGRLREAAIRSALGASRGRLVVKALLEQLFVSTLGGALGLLVASIALQLFIRTAPIDLPRVDDVALDGRVIAFTALVAALAGVLVALAPAWRMAGRDVQAALRAHATSVAGDRRALRSHATLLTAQIGLSVALLVITALLGVSLMRVLRADRGFTADRVLAVDLALPASRYADEPQRQAAFDRILAAVHELPGVNRATTTSLLPLRGQAQVNFVVVEGSTTPVTQSPTANFRFVAPAFFQALGIAIVRGRSFTDGERDPGRPTPALVSEPMAAQLWPGQNPLGQRFSRGLTSEPGFEVVGVVAEARTTSLERADPAMVYVPYWWRSRPSMSLLISTSVEPSSLAPAVTRTLREIDPEIAVGAARPLQTLVDDALAGRRYQTRLFVSFGIVALFIAVIGVYAVTSYGISRRRREMNVRVALGAQRPQVVGLVLRQALTPVAVGLLVGAAGALALGGVVASLLFEVRARDPLVIAAVVALVGAVGAAACGFAARQTLTIDPAAALREE